MLLSVSLGGAACLTILMGLLALGGMFFWKAENVFSEKKPVWLIGVTWAYLTFAILGWMSFIEEMSPMRLLATGMVTIAALKLMFVFLSYPHFMPIGRAVWNNRIAFSVIMTSSLIVGGLMLFVVNLL